MQNYCILVPPTVPQEVYEKCSDKLQLIDYADVYKVKDYYKIGIEERTSSDMWESTNNNCTDKDWVLCYSRQSDPNDFQVGIMTDTQKDFLLNYGPKLLCIDTTFKAGHH
ncbi:hypothetical protein BLOT_008133 [Blomia tropicalis]|nr:hypothetical protein BLOT_008133 [Blomia tropicalis]